MFRRRRFTRRRPIRRRITPRRMFRARKSLKISRKFVHSYTRHNTLTNITSASSGLVTTLSWDFASMNGSTKFSTIYKYFRINAVRYTFIVDQNNSQVGTASAFAPEITSCINRDPTPIVPATESDILNFPSSKTTCLTNGRKHVVYIKKPNVDISTSTVPIPTGRQWFPCFAGVGTSLNGTTFNGISFFIKNLNAQTSIRVYRKDYFQLKGIY